MLSRKKKKNWWTTEKAGTWRVLISHFWINSRDPQGDLSYQCLRTLGMAVHDLNKSSCGCVELEGQGLQGYPFLSIIILIIIFSSNAELWAFAVYTKKKYSRILRNVKFMHRKLSFTSCYMKCLLITCKSWQLNRAVNTHGKWFWMWADYYLGSLIRKQEVTVVLYSLL